MEAEKYSPQEIEKKWQEKWAADGIYKVGESDPRPKWYELTMFPYTSGDLHIGHWFAMAPADVHARFRRMQGYNVIHPMGFDAFGLPAENAAIQRGIHPLRWTMDNIENMRRQLKTMGAVYDWDREVITCVPEYYKWTQWFFLKLYEAGLAYRAKAPVVWCPKCQTVLANEQVVGGEECERCGTAITRKDLEQWFFRITKYADELLDFSGIEWPEKINIMQRNWIGRSEGVEIAFDLDCEGVEEKEIRVFTTRPDTTYGVTFMVLAPEHPLVEKITTPENRQAVHQYVAEARRQTEIERLSTEKEKSGVFTGTYCINRLSGQKVALYVADYVLLSYGTGIVMGVPAHDTRDFAFAKKYDIPIVVVIAPPDWKGGELEDAYIEVGTMVNSGQFDGMPSDKGLDAIADFMEKEGAGRRTVSYRLRDWLISRQRYWGAPIPMIYCDACGVVPVPEKDLPVLLPEDAEFKPTGESPLKYHEGFVNTVCPQCGAPAKRETDTMDTFMCSSWYFLRYACPDYDQGAIDPARVKYWLPVDQYTGGAEHAVMHLLYARFFTRAIRDMGLVDFDEPFVRLFNQGTITRGGAKISKSRGNVVNPDQYVQDLGADTMRAYLMFVGPWEMGGDWNDDGIVGMSRWFNRVWNLALRDPRDLPEQGDAAAMKELRHRTHKTIKKAAEDGERFQFNTMLAALMEFTNYLSKAHDSGKIDRASWREAIDALLLLLAPTAPHLTEELWVRTGHQYSIHSQLLPKWDDRLVREEEISLVVQINGKVRGRCTAPADISEETAQELALSQDNVRSHLEGKQVVKVIYVPGKLVNIVVR
jgi:leucyl-tRNA synthetase